MLRTAYLLIYWVFVHCCKPAGSVPLGSPDATAVTHPAQLQQAIRAGVKHVVVRQHLDMTSTPAFREAVSMDDGMLSLIPNAAGNHTQSIRGNCSGPAPTSNTLYPPLASGQCLITVREDFLEVPTQNSQAWISNLYVTLPGVQKNHTTLIGVHGGDLYMTNMTFVADGDKARAIDVGEGTRVYVGQSYFSNFAKDQDAVIRLNAGARATITDTAFVNNSVASDISGITSAGPVMGLYTRLSHGHRRWAAAWFQDCTFNGSSSSVAGEVSVENRQCRVYSNSEDPRVWDVELSRKVGPWPLIVSDGSGADVLAMNQPSKDAFLRPSDSLFQLILEDQAASTALEAAVIPRLPLGTTFITQDPYPEFSGGTKDRLWTGKTISLTAGLCTFVLLCLLVGCLLFVYRHELVHRYKLKRCPQGAVVQTEFHGCTTEREPSTGPTETFVTLDSSCIPKTPPSPADPPADPGITVVNDSTLMVPPDVAGAAGGPLGVSRPSSQSKARSQKDVCVTEGDMTKTSWPDFQKIAEGCKTPLQELEVALDAMCAMEHLFYYRFRILSAMDRRVGGQGVVQVASMMNTEQRAAIKFYLDKKAFTRERSLYLNPELQSAMPATLLIEDNSHRRCKTPYGYIFPPFVVIECGQSLNDWSRHNKPDFITIFQVLSHAVRALAKLHSCGYAHRDVKPGNILRRPNQHDWTLIDFGCTAKIGSIARLTYSLKYSPPEVAVAIEAGSKSIQVDSAIDIWAVGVIAFELLTGERVFNHVGVDPASAKLEILAALAGRHQLPWERSDAAQRLSKLRGLRRTVMRCLSRHPSQRPSARALVQSWEKTFDNMLLRDTNTFTKSKSIDAS